MLGCSTLPLALHTLPVNDTVEVIFGFAILGRGEVLVGSGGVSRLDTDGFALDF